MESERKKWLKFWGKTDDVGHAFNNKKWHEKYSKELLLFINPNKNQIAIDTGCGAGELMIEMAPHFKKLHGIDFSSKMIKKAKENLKSAEIKNVSISCLDLLSIKEINHSNIDHIYNNQVIQYLNINEIEQYLIESKEMLNHNGKIYFFNIPNKVFMDIFGIGLFRLKKKLNWKKLNWKIFKLHYDIQKEKLKNKNYQYDGGLGNWYSTNDLKLLANKLNLEVDFFSPIYLHHSYRFHAIFSKNNDIK